MPENSASTRPLRPGLLTLAAYSGIFVFGIVMALLGSVLPDLSQRLQFRVSEIGTLFVIMNLAMLVCSLVAGYVMDRFGLWPPMAAGPLMVAGALVMVAGARTFGDLLPAVALLGFGGGALNAATNVLISDLHEDAARKGSALNLLGVFYGFGALSLPFAIGALLSTFSVARLLWAGAGLSILVGLFSAVLRFPPAKQGRALAFGDMFGFLRSGLVLAMGLLLFFQSGVEATMGGFTTTFLTRTLGLSVAAASWLLAAYWSALMISRVALSRVLLAVSPHATVFGCAVLAAAGALLLAISPGTAVAGAGIVLTGAALAGIFPTVLGIAGTHFKEHSGTVFGLLFTMALCGGMSLPWVSGQVAEAAGLRGVFVVVAAAFLSIAVLSRVVRRISR